MATESNVDYEGLRPPANTLGLRVVYPDQKIANNAVLDVVFVHGLGSNCFSAWTKDKTLWIQDLLVKSSFYKNARILTFGYDARAFLRPFAKSTRGKTFTFAEALCSDLTDKRVSPAAKRRPIVFIGHSLGGIVIKAALRHAHALETLYGDLLMSTKAIMFFGTPHQGADIASWAALLGNLGKALGVRKTEVVEELQQWSDPLVELTTVFSELAPRFDITTYFETLKTNGVLVVPQGSAKMGQKNEQARALHANHSDICKFTEDDPNWHIVFGRLEAVAESIETANLVVLPKVPSLHPCMRVEGTKEHDHGEDDILDLRLKKLGYND